MRVLDFILLVTLMLAFFTLNTNAHSEIIAAVYDQGCSTHPHKVIEQKQIKDTYNYDSLRNEG